MNKYYLTYQNAIKHISFIDKIKLLFVKPTYLYCKDKEFNFKIKYKQYKDKMYILEETWEMSNEFGNNK